MCPAHNLHDDVYIHKKSGTKSTNAHNKALLIISLWISFYMNTYLYHSENENWMADKNSQVMDQKVDNDEQANSIARITPSRRTQENVVEIPKHFNI